MTAVSKNNPPEGFQRKQLLPLLLDRYVLSALLTAFVFSVAAFTGIGVAVGVVFDLVQDFADTQIPLSLLLQLLWLQLPYTISFCLPMGVLLASLSTFNRLSADSELVALQSVGVGIYRLVLPVVLFGLLVGGLTFGFNTSLVPASRSQSSQLLQELVQQGQAVTQAQNIFYPQYGPDREIQRLFYARQFDGQQMYGLTVLDFSQTGVNQVITAESAVWDAVTNVWTFTNGTIYLVDADGSYRNILQFTEQQLQIPRDPLALATPKPSIAEMSLAEARRYLEELQPDGDPREIRKLQLYIQQQYAIPWQGLILGLIGAGLGIKSQPRRKSRGFGLSLVIIFAQYLLSFLTAALARSGGLSPLVAAWSVNGLGLGVALWLLLRAAHGRPDR